jgi:hypothetical protein
MNIIQDTLELIRQRLNSYFQAADPSPDDWVILSNIVDQEGRAIEDCRNKIVIFLANIQQDTTISTWRPTTPLDGNRFAVVQPPLYINLHLLFYANFSAQNYPQGLGMICRTIQFFQENSFFTHTNLPDLPGPIDKLSFEFTNLDAVGLSYLMGLAGVNYLPSVYYKVRMFPFRSGAIQQQVSASQGYSTPQEPADKLAADIEGRKGEGG